MPCSPPLLTMPFRKKENLWCQVTKLCQTLLMVSVAYSQGQIQGGRYLLTSHLKNVFVVHNFSIIWNLFDSDKLYALLSTHNRKSASKIFGEALRIRVKKSKICLKSLKNALKQPLQHVNFPTFSGRARPWTPLEPLLFLNQPQISSLKKKIRLRKM